MITNFTRDATSAAKSDSPAFISESGAYAGVIRQAYTYTSLGGAQMMNFNFMDRETGAIAWIDLCVTKRDGTPAFGMDLFNALLTCMGVDSCNAVQGKARNRKGEVFDAYRIKEIENRPIGLVLQKELSSYTGNDGEIHDSYRMNLFKPFDAQSHKTATEIIKGSEAKNLDACLKNLKDRDTRSQNRQTASASASNATEKAVDTYDDCPF